MPLTQGRVFQLSANFPSHVVYKDIVALQLINCFFCHPIELASGEFPGLMFLEGIGSQIGWSRGNRDQAD